MARLLLRGKPLGCRSDGRDGAAPIEAVLFDKDGTLSHSEPMLLALARARIRHCLTLADPEGDAPDRQQRLRQLLEQAYGLRAGGLDPAGITAVAARDHNLIATATALTQAGFGWPDALALAERCFAATDGLHGAGSATPPGPTEGLAALLSRLRSADVRCAVISNDDVDGIHAFLNGHGLQEHFCAIWSAGHSPRKPAPEAVHALCELLGVEAARCALVGDADSDLRMARGAGVPVVLGYAAAWHLTPALSAADHTLSHWDELNAEAD